MHARLHTCALCVCVCVRACVRAHVCVKELIDSEMMPSSHVCMFSKEVKGEIMPRSPLCVCVCASMLHSSLECAESHVAGCEKCQQDTIKVIAGKVNNQLAETCRDPPETKCRVMAALDCKDRLLDFSMDSSEESDSLLCL